MKAFTYIEHGRFAFTEKGKIDTTPLITHRVPLSRIEEAYDIFENKKDGVIKVAIYPDDKE